MWVVKLGGSLMRSRSLPRWLAAIHQHHRQEIIIVPGGGVFADQVRQSQAEWRFDDLSAHKMAILAMEQYGLMLAGLLPDLTPVRTEAEMRLAFAAGRAAVWLPYRLLLEDAAAIPANWDLSSDSLGLWLARRLESEQYLMIKPGAYRKPMTLDEYIRRGVIDAGMAEMSQGYRGDIHLLWEGQYEDFHRLAVEAGQAPQSAVGSIPPMRP